MTTPILKLPVLDHGHATLRNISGPTRRPETLFDAHSVDPANSARMSFGNANQDRDMEQELRLCKYLLTHSHWTPVEMIEVWFEMYLPIFVARQFVRHRTACINEISGRYVKLPEHWYIPEVVGAKPPVGGAKQGQVLDLDFELQEDFKLALKMQCRDSYRSYEHFLEQGVAPEHARLFLHLNHYTHWLWKQDLRNMLGFLALRLDSHAQIEAQAYALRMLSLLRLAIPDLMLIAVPDSFNEDAVSLDQFRDYKDD